MPWNESRAIVDVGVDVNFVLLEPVANAASLFVISFTRIMKTAMECNYSIL
jgi:hypothetical protein